MEYKSSCIFLCNSPMSFALSIKAVKSTNAVTVLFISNTSYLYKSKTRFDLVLTLVEPQHELFFATYTLTNRHTLYLPLFISTDELYIIVLDCMVLGPLPNLTLFLKSFWKLLGIRKGDLPTVNVLLT